MQKIAEIKGFAATEQIGGILLTRHIVAFIASAGFFFLLPLELPLRQSVAIALLAPVGTVSTAMAVRAGGDPGMAAGANSVSILISIPLILGLLALFGSV